MTTNAISWFCRLRKCYLKFNATVTEKVQHMNMSRKLIIALTGCVVLVGCERDAQVASRNLSRAAEMFEINRRVIFFNGITDTYMMTIEGRCSIEDQKNQLEVTCKTGPSAFKKHFLGLSDNVSYFVEQLGTADVSVFHHRVVFRPQSIIPDVDFQGNTQELLTDRHIRMDHMTPR